MQDMPRNSQVMELVDAGTGVRTELPILTPTLGPEMVDVRAVKQGHVAAIADEAVLRPGPRIADGVESLARSIRSVR